jgi:Recombination endonuclease VII
MSRAAYLAEWRKSNQDSVKASSKKSDIKKRFRATGWTKEAYSEKLKEQNGLCAICLKPESASIRGEARGLCADHDHQTNKPRGLLCHNCNIGIGNLRDDPTLMLAAANYINRYKE